MVDFDYSDMGSYLVSMARRIAQLEVKSVEMEEVIDEESDLISHTYNEFEHEIKMLNKELKQLREELSDVKRSVNSLVENFKQVARMHSKERLERKIEAWSPEDMATHRDMHRALKKLKSPSSEP